MGENQPKRAVKIVWSEPKENGDQEPHVAHGILLSEEGEHFTLSVQGGRMLYISKKATVKMVDEGVRQ